MKTIDKILLTIKQDGPQTAKQLAETLDMTTMGARQHLQKLESCGTLYSYTQRVKVGRPNRFWSLTEEGINECFADTHNILSVELIDAVEDLFGKEALTKIVSRREKITLDKFKAALSTTATLAEKLAIIIKMREDSGYLAQLEKKDDCYIIYENHCPICCAAKRCPDLCNSEFHIFSELLKGEATVVRKENIVAGERRCTYIVTPKS